MTAKPHRITRAEIMDMDAYVKVRGARRKRIIELKRHRRVAVGPFATFHFESFDTMWHQIHEMLYVEKGGEDQIEGELEAFNPLIPKGQELVATLMFEIVDPEHRLRALAELGGVDHTVTLSLDGEEIAAQPEGDLERTTAEGKTSAVHFLRFALTPGAVRAFKIPDTRVVLAITHKNYAHMAVLPEEVRAALATDLD